MFEETARDERSRTKTVTAHVAALKLGLGLAPLALGVLHCIPTFSSVPFATPTRHDKKTSLISALVSPLAK